MKGSGEMLEHWRLTDNPFGVRPPTLSRWRELEKVFTGREEELGRTLFTLSGKQPKSVFVYGWFGIGKTAFIIRALSRLRQERLRKTTFITKALSRLGRGRQRVLTTYVSLPKEAEDIATFALIALARAMPNDQWAQRVLQQMGMPPDRPAVRKKTEVDMKFAKVSEETEETTLPSYPTLSFEDLLDRALETHEKVVIAIDDLDKLDPSQVREMLRAAQGMLKGNACFILTGHPVGITKDIYTSELGLFDIHVEIREFDYETTYRMLVNYLNSVRLGGKSREIDDPAAVFPFTSEAAKALCERSFGIPRYLNRLAGYVFVEAAVQQAAVIDNEVLTKGFEYAAEQVRSGIITPEERYILEIVLEKGSISDENITNQELEKLGIQGFHEVMPILDQLTKRDLLQRANSDWAIIFKPSPLLL